MLRLRWFHHTQAALVALLGLTVVASLGGVLWLNEVGFAGEWGERIEDELAQHGIHADFATVRFSPARGIVAREVVIYSDASRREIVAEIPLLEFEVDNGKALRGELQIRQVILHEARLSLPVSSDRAHKLEFTALTGRASLDRQNRFILEGASGLLGGMAFTLEVELDEFDPASLATEQDRDSLQRRDEFVADALAELAQWSFPSSRPAELDLRITGSARRPGSIRTTFSISAAELTRRDYTMQDVRFAGELHGPTLSIDQLRFSDGHGWLEADAGYDLDDKRGRYRLTSSIQPGDLLRRAFDHHALDDLSSAHAPLLDARGEFGLSPAKPAFSIMGDLAWPHFRFLGTPFENLRTEFSWRNGNLFLRDLLVTHKQGELSGRILIEGDLIRYEARSSLPPSVYRTFLPENGGIERALARVRFSSDSTALIEAEGSIGTGDRHTWESRGHATFGNFSYNDVPLAKARTTFEISPEGADYRDLEATFDYASYPLRRLHGGPSRALVRAEQIRYDGSSKLIHATRIQGTAWPGPVLRLFLPPVAAHIEEEYGLRSPPEFNASGVIDARSPGIRTDITTRMRAHGTTDYGFLDRTLQLTSLSATIRTRHHHHEVTDLRCNTLGSSLGGTITVLERPGRAPAYSGGLQWNDASLPQIARKFVFGKPAQGMLTGRIDFSGVAGRIRSFNGNGLVALRHGQLFDVPVFGPLSAPVGTVLGNKRFGLQQARDASASFVIRNGVAFIDDFHTSTPSTVFTGEGQLDLATRHLDMTVRMNARGLLGLVTLPLRPFHGLFQFHGRGPMKNPVWSNAPFTQPARGSNDPVFRTPPRAQIIPER